MGPLYVFAEARIQAWMRPGEKFELVFGFLRGEPPETLTDIAMIMPQMCADIQMSFW